MPRDPIQREIHTRPVERRESHNPMVQCSQCKHAAYGDVGDTFLCPNCGTKLRVGRNRVTSPIRDK